MNRCNICKGKRYLQGKFLIRCYNCNQKVVFTPSIKKTSNEWEPFFVKKVKSKKEVFYALAKHKPTGLYSLCGECGSEIIAISFAKGQARFYNDMYYPPEAARGQTLKKLGFSEKELYKISTK